MLLKKSSLFGSSDGDGWVVWSQLYELDSFAVLSLTDSNSPTSKEVAAEDFEVSQDVCVTTCNTAVHRVTKKLCKFVSVRTSLNFDQF